MDSPTATSAPPDWSRIERDILCPLCDYNLRGLSEARCPECGYQFIWDEVLNEHVRPHPYLFEHHPERNTWSFVRTLFGSATFPASFWKSVHPTQEIRFRRLILYWLMIASICLLPFIVRYGHAVIERNELNLVIRNQTIAFWGVQQNLKPPRGPSANYLDASAPLWPNPNLFLDTLTSYYVKPHFFLAMFLLLWPWMTFAALMIFQKSMNRAMIKRRHVLRCIIYSISASVWLSLMSGALLAYEVFSKYQNRSRFRRIISSWLEYHAFALIVIGFLVLAVYLTIAYRRYLRFPHAMMVIIATQVIIGLLAFKLALDWRVINIYLF